MRCIKGINYFFNCQCSLIWIDFSYWDGVSYQRAWPLSHQEGCKASACSSALLIFCFPAQHPLTFWSWWGELWLYRTTFAEYSVPDSGKSLTQHLRNQNSWRSLSEQINITSVKYPTATVEMVACNITKWQHKPLSWFQPQLPPFWNFIFNYRKLN